MIFFDVDGTLVDHQGAQDCAALLFLEQFAHVLPHPAEGFCTVWQSVMEKHWESFARGEITFAEQRRRRIRDIFEASTTLSDEEADVHFTTYLQHYERSWRLFDDVLPCLDALAGQRLGIITNGNAEQQVKKLQQTGIADRFSCVIASEAIGAWKPKPEIFWEACHRAGTEPQQCMYVGDSLELDALAAQAAGLKGVWLDRHTRSHAPVEVPIIATLERLVAII
jgi:putative hydrolase of the HAD superfamily